MDSPGEKGSPPARLLPRTLAFLVLLALADLWANRHFEVGIDHPGLLASLGGALTAAAGLADKLGTGGDAKAWIARLWAWVGRRLTGGVIAVLWVVALIVGVTVSSVVVTQDGAAGAVSVTPVAGGHVRPRAAEPGKPRRFIVSTTPFSKRYAVKVEGFLPATVDVPPLVGQTVAVGRDLRPVPSVLFRPTLPALASLERGRFLLHVKNGTERRTIGSAQGTRASFLLGRARPIPADWIMLWRFELESRSADPVQVARALLDWSRRTAVGQDVEVAPGMHLVAEVRSRADKLVACREWTVGTDDLADVALVDVPEESQDAECR